jgi:hypothetical protein
MALRGPFTVHASGLGVEKQLDVADLEFTKTAHGGYDSATVTMPDWVDSADPALGSVSRFMVDDGRNCRRIFEGYLELPGKTVSPEGHVWKLGVVGASSVLADRAHAYIGIDTDLTRWTLFKSTSPGATAEATTLPSDETEPALLFQFPAGQPVDNSSYMTMQYDLRPTGQYVGAYNYSRVGGYVSGGTYQQQSLVRASGTGTKTTLRATGLTSVAGTGLAVDQVGSQWTGTMDRLSFVLAKVLGGATNVATDTVWAAFYDVYVRAQLHDLTGALLSTPNHTNPYVLTHEIVTDCLTMFTSVIDTAGSTVDTGFTEQITQLAYPDPVRFPDILNDLAMITPMVWEVSESNPQGKHRFNLRQWPTDVRYEATTADGWDSPGAEQDLGTDVRVTWVDANGAPQTYTVQTAVPVLDQWGRRRDAVSIDLGSETGSLAAATTIAAAFNTAMAAAPFAGTLTVARPIRDLYMGREIEPWEIQPGYLVNVRDIAGPPMQLTEMSYRDSEQMATLTLGTPVFDVDQMVANLARRRNRANGQPTVPATP